MAWKGSTDIARTHVFRPVKNSVSFSTILLTNADTELEVREEIPFRSVKRKVYVALNLDILLSLT
jgi:hypothetical protein